MPNKKPDQLPSGNHPDPSKQFPVTLAISGQRSSIPQKLENNETGEFISRLPGVAFNRSLEQVEDTRMVDILRCGQAYVTRFFAAALKKLIGIW